MRILAIRGKNLASLAGDFAVDFQLAPLEGAGVFAISGPTGAGKSTLLDALCLALYHDTPRLLGAKENNVNVPDVGEHTLSPQDPRNLLRRGCAEGHAEVDFIGHDGIPRRALWQIRRARGKLDGKMQNASASLRRLDTDVVESTATRETRDKIEACIGLSFDQFRRAVLLAQNDFATLLKAGNNERADLLEALTNTGIFSRLSKAAYERHRSEQDAVEDLRRELNVLSTLPADEREQLDTEVTASKAQCQQLAASLAALNDEQQWHARGQHLQQQCVKADQERERQQQAINADRPLQQQLQRWNAIAPLRPLWDNRLGIIDQQHRLQASLPGLDDAIAQSRLAEESASTGSKTAQLALNDARQKQHEAQPILLAARQMDEAIRQQQRQQNDQQKTLTKTRAEHQTLDTTCRDTRRQQLALQATVDAWPQWRATHPSLGTDDATWPATGEDLRKAHELQQQLVQSRSDIAALEKHQQSGQRELDATTKAANEAATALTTALAALETCSDAFHALDPASLTTRQQSLHTRTRQVEKLAVTLTALTASETQHADATEQLAKLQQKLADDEAAIAAARGNTEAADTLAADARTAFEHASLAADQITQRLRDELKPGEPCLVCGAREHPLADTPHLGMDDLLATLRQQRDDAQQARDTAHTHHAHATTEFAATQRAIKTATGLLDSANPRREQARADCQGALGAIEGTDVTISAQDSRALTGILHNLQEALEQHGATLEQATQQIQQAQQALDHARAAVEQQRQHADDARAKRESAQEKLAPLAANLLTRKALRDKNSEVLQQTWQRLQQHTANPTLDPAQLDPLWADWLAGEAIRNTANKARAPLAGSSSTVQAHEGQLLALTTQIGEFEQALSTLDTALSESRTLRHQTLAEPDVEAYAKRLQQAETQASTHAAELIDAHTKAGQLHTAAVLARQTATHITDELNTRLETSTGQLIEQLAQHAKAAGEPALSLDELAVMIGSLPQDLAQRNAAQKQREQALLDASAAWLAVNQQFADWTAEARSTRTPDEVTAEQASITQQHTTATEMQADLRARQREDQRRHEQAAEHRARIDALTAGVRRWQQLNALIGSAGGDKFKTYAQQFTLDVLLDYANQHLSRLAPRYQLRRGSELLTLLVVDGDFADEVRSVHSLSGGESFLVSLALALGLASLSSERVRVESLFIDEGFGSLDADTLNMAMEALDRLQSEGRRVGVISHVHDMAERIGVQIKVRPVAPGRSVVEIVG